MYVYVQGVQSGQFFRIFNILLFCFVVSIFDLVQDVEAIFHLPKLLIFNSIWIFFLKYE